MTFSFVKLDDDGLKKHFLKNVGVGKLEGKKIIHTTNIGNDCSSLSVHFLESDPEAWDCEFSLVVMLFSDTQLLLVDSECPECYYEQLIKEVFNDIVKVENVPIEESLTYPSYISLNNTPMTVKYTTTTC